MYRHFFKYLLFLLPAEAAHNLGMLGVRFIGALHRAGMIKRAAWADDPRLVRESPFGTLPTSLGLAAGFDKNARALWGWQALGFSFAEVGTATPEPQEGNSKPRLFRFPKYEAIINRMGFNNHGAKRIAMRVQRAKAQGLKIKVGANIGKNKSTPAEQAAEDYRKCAAIFKNCADYIVINVSSPNTPGLRDLQGEQTLDDIVAAVRAEVRELPVFVKVAPDNFQTYIDGVSAVLKRHKIDGVICGNTLANHAAAHGIPAQQVVKFPQGGLSGRPVFGHNIHLCEAYAVRGFYVIGVGGIFSHTDAIRYFQAGAKLIQIYSGLVYEGPGFVKSLLNQLIQSSIQRNSVQKN